MKRMWLIAVAALLLTGLFAGTHPSDAINAQDTNAEATISALQTQVSGLQTQVATLSPTPTGTPAPLPTVATEPQMLTEGLELLYYYAVAEGSSTTLLGEVRNTTDQVIGSPYFEIILLDADGNIVGTTNASPALVTTGPGESIPFEARASDVARDEWHQATITACEWGSEYYVEEGYGPSPTLQLQEVVEAEKSSDQLVIKGVVLNSGDAPAEPVQVKALVYLPDGRYAGHASTFIDVPIPAGKTARFSLEGRTYNVPALDFPEIGDSYSYRLWVGTEPSAKVYAC
jgi:hypothetical protein